MRPEDAPHPSWHTQVRRALDGYFDTRTSVLVERVVELADPDHLEDEAALADLFTTFVDALEERYGRNDPGWRDASAAFLAREFDRQVDERRRFNRSLLDR